MPSHDFGRSGALRLAAVCLLAATSATGQEARPSPPPVVIQSAVDLVRVDLAVSDARGHPVVDLEAADFEILEDGRRQTVTHCQYVVLAPARAVAAGGAAGPARPEDVRRAIALLVDADRAFPTIAQALTRFVDEQIGPDDLAAVVTTRDGARILQPFTSDKRLLRAAISALADRPVQARESAMEAIGCEGLPPDVIDDCERTRELGMQHRLDRRLLGRLDGIESVLQALQALPGRKSLVLFSSLLNTSQRWGGNTDDREDWVQSLADLANRAGVVVYTLGASSLPDMVAAKLPREMSRWTDTLKRLARETGGLFVDSGPAALVRAVAEDQSGYYLLGYTPDESFLRRRHHQIRVEVKRRDLVVRTRARYYVPAERARAAAPSVDPAWLAATSPFAQTGLALVPAADFTADAKERTVQCAFRVAPAGLSFVERPDGTTGLELEVLTVAFSAGGIASRATTHKPLLRLAAEQAEVVRRDGLELSGTVDIPGPGVYRVQVVVKDAASGRVGSLSQVVETHAVSHAATTAPAAPVPDYLVPIAVARAGDPRLAVAAVLDGPAKRIANHAESLRVDARCPQACRRAGILLHTEAAFLNAQLGRRDLERAHFAAADALARTTAGDHAAVGEEFERTWRLAVARRHQEWAEPDRAFPIYNAVLKRHPDDPEALVARGTLAELLTTGYQDARVRGPLFTADAAQRDYERALALRPDFAEARLRLGRVLGIRGRSKATRAADARRELRRVLDEDPTADIRAYAHLFLGQVEETESRLPAAMDEYRAALNVDPRLQPAQLALSRALQKAGRPDEAGAVLLEGLRATRDGVHGWYGYHTDALQSYEASMDRLWKEARE